MAITVRFKCKEHPEYKAIKEPTADCWACEEIYDLRQEAECVNNTASDMFPDGSVIVATLVEVAEG